jgi:hypothetical protein
MDSDVHYLISRRIITAIAFMVLISNGFGGIHYNYLFHYVKINNGNHEKILLLTVM